MKIPHHIIDFLLDVEIASSSMGLSNPEWTFKELQYSTNEYSAKIYLKFNPNHEESKVFNGLSEFLRTINYSYQKEAIIGLVVLFALLDKRLRSIDWINQFFQLIKPLKIKQYMFFLAIPDEKVAGLKFNDFTIGHIDYKKFANFISNHSGSDYAIRYVEHHKKAVGIEMKSRTIYSVEVYQWLMQIGQNTKNISRGTEELVNYYFNNLAVSSYEKFKDEFHKQQMLVNTIVGVTFSLDEFNYLGFQFVNIFYGFSNSSALGWVLPYQSRVNKLFFPDPRVLSVANSFIEKEEQNIKQYDNAFKRVMEISLEFFSNGQRNIVKKSINNAYVDYFVGLDFLLAPDTEKSKKLKQRLTFLTFTVLNANFEEQMKRMDYLYDIRSEYVHNGKSVDKKDLIELRNISRIMILILMRLVTRSKNIGSNAYDEWLSKIDVGVQDIYRGKQPNTKLLSELGIVNIDKHYLSDVL